MNQTDMWIWSTQPLTLQKLTQNMFSKMFVLELWICLEVFFKIIFCCLRHKAQCRLDPKLSSKADFQAKNLVGFEVYRQVKARWDRRSPLSKLKQTSMAAKFNKTTFIWSTPNKANKLSVRIGNICSERVCTPYRFVH